MGLDVSGLACKFGDAISQICGWQSTEFAFLGLLNSARWIFGTVATIDAPLKDAPQISEDMVRLCWRSIARNFINEPLHYRWRHSCHSELAKWLAKPRGERLGDAGEISVV